MCDEIHSCAIESYSDSDTRKLGERIGTVAGAGDLICLNGDLGAGKTTLVQGIAEGLGLPAHQVSSPTFALLAEHLQGRIPLYHLDVYRLGNPAGLYDLGFDDYLRVTDGLIVIEWAELVMTELQFERVNIDISIGPDAGSRTLMVTGYGEAGRRLASKLC